MTPRPLRHALAASAAAIFALTLAGCGGGNDEQPPQTGGNVVAAAAPVVTITDDVIGDKATGAITFTFAFNRDVGTSFSADDVTVTGGAKGAFTRMGSTGATLVVQPAAGTAGTVTVSLASGAVADAVGTANAAASASRAFDIAAVVPPPAGGGVVLADFDGVTPAVVVGYDGAEGSSIEAGPAGGGSGRSFKVLRSGGQNYALGVIETTLPLTATRRLLTAQVYAPLAGIPMVMKLEGPGGANSGEVQANEAVVAGWQTLTWTFSAANASQTFNKLVLLPRLGTVDPAPGQAYYYDNISLGDVAALPVTGTVLANFDDVSPTAVGYDGAEGSSIETGPAGGGAGRTFRVLRFGGQTYALGVVEVVVPFTATRRTLSAQVHVPVAGIPMVIKIEGPGGVTTPEVPANEVVVAGWQTLTWTFTSANPSLTYNKIVLLPRLGTVDAPPGQSYYYDGITLLD
jgi:Bacterial Ig-like domain